MSAMVVTPVVTPPARFAARRPGTVRPRVRRLLVVTLLVVTAVAIVGGTLARATGTGSAGPRTVTVQPGDTLSHIAVRELPDLPMRNAVAEIQLANRLNTTQIHAGQRLVIPPAG